MSMQLHAPLYEKNHNTRLEEDDIQIAYSIDARLLPAGKNTLRNEILRIHIELLDQIGQPVTANAVVLDLLDHPDGNRRITRIRLDSLRGQHKPRPWQMKYWSTQVNALLNHQDKPDLSPAKSHQPKPNHPQEATKSATKNAPENAPENASENASESESQVGFIFSSYLSPSAYIYSSDRGHHGHRRPHDHDQDDSFLRLVRPIVLPAFLGIGAGLVACVLGFCVGHLVMSLASCLGLCKKRTRQRYARSRLACIEEGTSSEKDQLIIPSIHITQSTDQ